MSRIILTTIGSLGDLHPKIAIAIELRKRGHDVVFATHQEYQHKIEALGFEFHRMRPDNTALSDPQEMARMMDLQTGTEYVVRNWVCASLRETHTDLMDEPQPDWQPISEVGDMSERRKSLGILHPFEFFLESFHLLPHVADIFG